MEYIYIYILFCLCQEFQRHTRAIEGDRQRKSRWVPPHMWKAIYNPVFVLFCILRKKAERNVMKYNPKEPSAKSTPLYVTDESDRHTYIKPYSGCRGLAIYPRPNANFKSFMCTYLIMNQLQLHTFFLHKETYKPLAPGDVYSQDGLCTSKQYIYFPSD